MVGPMMILKLGELCTLASMYDESMISRQINLIFSAHLCDFHVQCSLARRLLNDGSINQTRPTRQKSM